VKPYQQKPIIECGEALVPVPSTFPRTLPHPYISLGAPYGEYSPFWLRAEVVNRLQQAITSLQAAQPGWQLQLFDGYRPLAVQHFMVEWTFREQAQLRGLDLTRLSASEKAGIYETVYQFWAEPATDPLTPPPHSTGGAVDLTLIDATGQMVAMGSPIDEISERSFPDYFVHQDPQVHYHRQILHHAMAQAGFARHPQEWWHFSYGDQLWAWLTHQPHAHYGRI